MKELRVAFARVVLGATPPAGAGVADGKLMFMTAKLTPAIAASCATRIRKLPAKRPSHRQRTLVPARCNAETSELAGGISKAVWHRVLSS